ALRLPEGRVRVRSLPGGEHGRPAALQGQHPVAQPLRREETRMKTRAVLLAALLAGAAFVLPPMAEAADPTVATAGADGTYPAGTRFTGVDLSAVQLAFGAEIDPAGAGSGNFTA